MSCIFCFILFSFFFISFNVVYSRICNTSVLIRVLFKFQLLSNRQKVCSACVFLGSRLGKARFLRGNITPFLDNWLLDLPWVGSGPGADLLGDINTFLLGFKFRHQFGYVLAGTLWLKSTLFLGSILDNSLSFVITFLFSFLESTSSRGTDLSGFLGAPGDGSVLLDSLLLNTANFLGPLRAFGVGGIA